MEPVVIVEALRFLSKIFKLGLEGYKAAKSWGMDAEGMAALQKVLSASIDLLAVKPENKSQDLTAHHLALVTRAFGAAFREHWGGNLSLAPVSGKPGWVSRVFLAKQTVERMEDVGVRIKLAIESLVASDSRGSTRGSLEHFSDLVEEPIGSRAYGVIWHAFTNPNFDDVGAVPLIDLNDDGAKLEFERSFRLAYAEAIATPEGAIFLNGLLELEHDRPRLVRELLVRGISTWKSCHVFGDGETSDIPAMPLQDIYVEPDGEYRNQEKENDTSSKLCKPILSLIHELLAKEKILVVRGDFGHGKSLTARTLAGQFAERYIGNNRTPSTKNVFPLFIKCGEDFPGSEPVLSSIVRRALQRQARTLGIDLAQDDGALGMPSGNQRVLFIIDGLDEVVLSTRQAHEFFGGLERDLGANWQAVVFGRKGAMPSEAKLRAIPMIDLLPLRLETPGQATEKDTGGQVGEWLDRWNRLSGHAPISVKDLSERGLLSVAKTPILLFMIAVTWDDDQRAATLVTRAEIYDRFLRQMASGKCKYDKDRHGPVADASAALFQQLVNLGELPKLAAEGSEAKSRVDAMIWMLARLAWEAQRRAEQNQDLSEIDVVTILDRELKITNDPNIADLVKVGVLLALQADHRGGNDRILFGHKSFREYLVARYWEGRLRAIVQTRKETRRSAKQEGMRLERQLYGAMLTGSEDNAIEFLIQMIDGSSWDNHDRELLVDWAEDAFNDEEPQFGDPPNYRSNQRAVVRLAALAIGSLTCGSRGINVNDHLSIRTLLGEFWIRGTLLRLIAPRIVARSSLLQQAELSRAILDGANLSGSVFFRANMVRSSFVRANLSKGLLLDAIGYRADFTSADLSNADFQSMKMNSGILVGANLRGAELDFASFEKSDFTGADLSEVRGECTRFVKVTLREANLSKATLLEADMTDADLTLANLSGATLTNSRLAGAKLYGANFLGANLDATDFGGATYDDDTKWPIGFDPQMRGAKHVLLISGQ